MPKLAANLSTLFQETSLENRPAAAAAAGFLAVEIKFFEQYPSDLFIDNLTASGLDLALFNANPGNLGAGEIGMASLPKQRQRFEAGLIKDLALAKRLGAPKMHVLCGMTDKELSRDQQYATAVDAYSWAAKTAAEHGVTLVVEPLAPAAMPGYFIHSLDQAVRLVEDVASDNFKILFDFFHMQFIGGDISRRLNDVADLIGHVQIAATPSRHEPDQGELNVDFIFNALDNIGYSGWVGCEYNPKTTTLAGLSWADKYLSRPKNSIPPIIKANEQSPVKAENLPTGTLLGRVWDPKAQGPCIVTVRDGIVFDITSKQAPLTSDICQIKNPVEFVKSASGQPIGELSEILQADTENDEIFHMLAPCDLQAIKACGVTFAASMVERVIEEQAAGDIKKAKAIRQRVQSIVGDSLRELQAGSDEAQRVKQALIEEGIWSQYLEVGIGPDAEVFSKAQVLSSVGYGAKIGLHPSSSWNNPEPELVLAVSPDGEIVGVSLGNDVNLRDIEGRSALLLSKAKDNNASCAIGPFIRLLDDEFTLDHIRQAQLSLTIKGVDDYLLEGNSSMNEISRDVKDLVAQTIGNHHQYPDGLMLFLGTGFAPTKDRDVPGEGFTHKLGDLVIVSSAGLGELQNIVDLSTNCPPWTFGVRQLMGNLAKRDLI
ncbi:Fumarylacetoacetate hydrolase family protein [hydrothermal vent metagenome]|uniref:Fumarylacetoacetate hydrolase family protein n=1 Tax=hydrothermal vent metagenome TaxID=652676 RepID=A0A3B0T2J8_9ZZZZ